jgi:hypothetical protein
MKNIKLSILAALGLCCATACMELDKAPLDMISSEAVFKDEALTTAYLYKIYGYMPCGYGVIKENTTYNIATGLGRTDLLDGSTDLLRSPAGWNESNGTMIVGTLRAAYNPLTIWDRAYEVIRKVNNLIAELNADCPLSGEFKNKVIAEARFVRAYMYFDLVRRHGDVPLIKALQSFDNLEDVLVPRTPASQIYDFVDEELSAIGEILPHAKDLSAAEYGRASREAAWALNGRAMLFAKRYERSALFSKKVMDENYFVLDPDYNALFQSYGGNKEVIFEVMYDGQNRGHAGDLYYMPPSLLSSWGGQTNPTQEIVDAYEMLDGTPFDWTNPIHAASPYDGRDKRLQASIIVDGATFRNTVIRTAYMTPADGLGNGTNRTITGYYLRKFMDEALPSEKLLNGSSLTSWKELRLGEVLLNYAEAQNEVNQGPDNSVYEAIRLVRERAGLPALPGGLGYATMKERIIHERKVELAFEGHRFWDLRRWRLAESVLHNKYFHGVRITEEAGVKKYDIIEVTTVPRQVFPPHVYLMPIPEAELNKNPNLRPQNEGY